MLIAGLAMVQMDANTENQFQVLSEIEMLKTQGAFSVDACEEFTHVAEGDQNRHENCKTKDCQTYWNGWGWSSYKQRGHTYVWCNGATVNPAKDCLTATNEEEGYQECAERQEYWGPYCNSWFARPFVWNVIIPAVQNTPHDPYIPCSSS